MRNIFPVLALLLAVVGVAQNPHQYPLPAGGGGTTYTGCTSDGANGIICTGALTGLSLIGALPNGLSNFQLSGPTVRRTYTFPNADATFVDMGLVTATEMSYLHGATSSIQTQLNARAVKELHVVLTGSGTGGLLQDTDDQPAVWLNTSTNATITAVWCQTDSATPLTVQLQNNPAVAVDVLTTPLSCTTTIATSSTFVTGQNIVANASNVDISVISAGGGAHWVAVHFTVTY